MAIAIDKEMRERAKKDDKYLLQLSLDPRQLSEETKEKFKGKAPTLIWFQLSGPLGPEEAVELWRLYRKWQKRNRI